jgi:hypothetical protein
MEGAISDDHALEFLLAFDGRIHHPEPGYWLKFAIKRLKPTPERPHGLRYSFTLHGPDGKRLLGFDNAHAVSRRGSRFGRPPVPYDHWHRTAHDEGQPYMFTTVEQLVADFEVEVARVLDGLRIANVVVRESDIREGRSR